MDETRWVVEYDVVLGENRTALMLDINSRLLAGWQPLGRATHVPRKDPEEFYWYQTMVRYRDAEECRLAAEKKQAAERVAERNREMAPFTADWNEFCDEYGLPNKIRNLVISHVRWGNAEQIELDTFLNMDPKRWLHIRGFGEGMKEDLLEAKADWERDAGYAQAIAESTVLNDGKI